MSKGSKLGIELYPFREQRRNTLIDQDISKVKKVFIWVKDEGSAEECQEALDILWAFLDRATKPLVRPRRYTVVNENKGVPTQSILDLFGRTNKWFFSLRVIGTGADDHVAIHERRKGQGSVLRLTLEGVTVGSLNGAFSSKATRDAMLMETHLTIRRSTLAPSFVRTTEGFREDFLGIHGFFTKVVMSPIPEDSDLPRMEFRGLSFVRCDLITNSVFDRILTESVRRLRLVQCGVYKPLYSKMRSLPKIFPLEIQGLKPGNKEILMSTQNARVITRPDGSMMFFGSAYGDIPKVIDLCAKKNVSHMGFDGYNIVELMDALVAAADRLPWLSHLSLMHILHKEDIDHVARALRKLPGIDHIDINPYALRESGEYVIGLVREIEGLPESTLKSITLCMWDGYRKVLTRVSAAECRKITKHYVYDFTPPQINLEPIGEAGRAVWSKLSGQNQ